MERGGKGGEVKRASRGIRAQVREVWPRSWVPNVPSLPNLHVIGWEEAVRAPAHASPPPLVDHLNVGDDVVGVKGDLVITG